MPKYRVKAGGPMIVFGRAKVRELYNPGDMIELSEEEAQKISGSLEMPHEKEAIEKQAIEPPPSDEGKEETKGSKKKGK
jgi:hypothetical protein